MSGVNSTWVDEEERNALANVGEVISHTCNITNEGTTTLFNICTTSDSIGDACLVCGEAETLRPRESFACTFESKVRTGLCVHDISRSRVEVRYITDGSTHIALRLLIIVWKHATLHLPCYLWSALQVGQDDIDAGEKGTMIRVSSFDAQRVAANTSFNAIVPLPRITEIKLGESAFFGS